jgi:hypothetical protein
MSENFASSPGDAKDGTQAKKAREHTSVGSKKAHIKGEPVAR